MFAGIAAGVMVTNGVWHVFEPLMHGRNKDTMAIAAYGVLYIVIGCLIAGLVGGWITQVVGLVATVVGVSAALMTMRTADVPHWVSWAFIVMDVVIIICLGVALLG